MVVKLQKCRFVWLAWISVLILLHSGCSETPKVKSPWPTDNELTSFLELHGVDLEKLIGIAQLNPKFIVISKRKIWPENLDLAPNKLGDYYALFDKLGVPDGLTHWREANQEAILVNFSSTGIAGHGATKGLAYSVEALQPQALSLDPPMKFVGSNHGKRFRPVKKNWYIFFDW